MLRSNLRQGIVAEFFISDPTGKGRRFLEKLGSRRHFFISVIRSTGAFQKNFEKNLIFF